MQRNHTRTTVWVSRPRRKFMKQVMASCIRQNSATRCRCLHEIPKNTTVNCVQTLSNTIGNDNSRWTRTQIQNSTQKHHRESNDACFGKRRINSYIWWLVESKLMDQVLVREMKRTWRSPKELSQRWSWSEDFLTVGVVPTGVRYTHSPVARTFFCSTDTVRTLRTFSCVLHICMAQGCLQCACRYSRHLIVSFLMFHPSSLLSLLLFLDGHFETTPLDDYTDDPVHDFLPNFPDLTAQVERSPHEDELFGYPAKSALNTGYEPKKFDKITSVDDHTTLINDPDHNISDFSRTTNEKTLVNSVFPQCLNPLFCTFLIGDFVLQRESKIGKTVARQREREEREGFAISVAKLMSMKSRRNRIRSHCLTENSILMIEIPEDTWNQALHKLFSVKIQIRQASTRLGTTWRSKIWNEEIQNTKHSSHSVSQRLQVLEAIPWTDQAHGDGGPSSSRMLCQKLQRNFTKIGKISYAAWSGITYNESIQVRRLPELLVYVEDAKITEQLWQCLRSSSSSCYLEFKKA